MFGKKKFEQSSLLKTAVERGNLIGHGMFWKLGSGVRNWKQRRYELYQNAYLIYLDASGSSTVAKGAITLENIVVRNGKEENIFHCGTPSAAIAAKRRALTIESVVPETRIFETVFESEEELIRFLNSLILVAPINNILAYCTKEGVDLSRTLRARSRSISGGDAPPPAPERSSSSSSIPAQVRPSVNRSSDSSASLLVRSSSSVGSDASNPSIESPVPSEVDDKTISGDQIDAAPPRLRLRQQSVVLPRISTEECNQLIARIRQGVDVKRAVEVFATIDSDKNNSIDKNEMAAAWNILNIVLSTDEIDAIFDRFDSDQSGYLDYQEFLALVADDKAVVDLPAFGLDFSDVRLASFSCAIHATKGLTFVHGRISITEFFLAFEGWPTTRLLIPLGTITAIDKVSTMRIFPNALLIKCADGEEYFFGSFTNRNGCYSFLKLKISEASRWKSDNPANLPWMTRNLVFGWQADAMNLSGRAATSTDASQTVTDSADTTADDDEEDENAAGAKEEDVNTPDEPNDDVDMDTLFLRCTIAPLLAETLPAPGHKTFTNMWKSSEKFKEFIVGEGDSSVVCGEWAPFTGPITEDISKLPFQFSRQCTYVHPQKKTAFTSAVNAKVIQSQYLYVYGRGSSTAGSVDAIRPRRGMVLTVSQFDGIPFSDYFKVLAYYGFDDSGNGEKDATSCTIRFGAAVHFCKSTMLKGQIQSGVVGELGEFAKHYFNFAKKRTERGVAAATGQASSSSDDASEVVTPNAPSNVESSSQVSTLLSTVNILIFCVGVIILLLILVILQWRANSRLQDLVALNHRRLDDFEALLRSQLVALGKGDCAKL